MNIRDLINPLKTKLRNIVFFSPLKKIVPETLRHRFGQKLMDKMSCRIRIPQPFIRNQFPFGVNLFGLFKAEIGLAQGVKLYADALEAAGIPHTCLNTDFLPWLSQNDRTYESRLGSDASHAFNIIHINPDFWGNACGLFPEGFFDGHYNIGVFLWELETIPETWLPVFDAVDEIWAPSEFIARAIRKATTKPVTVIPYGIFVPVDKTVNRSTFGFDESDFLVLTMYDSNSYASRKNPGAAIDAFLEAFGPNPLHERLVIKVNNAKEEDIQYIRSRLGEKGPYYLITDRLGKTTLNSMIRCCDAFISLHRSEGFGLVMAEAMALGIPVIATGWSSNVEFMPPEATCLVDYKLIPVKGDYQFGMEDQVWADPDPLQAATYLRELREDPVRRAELARLGQAHILSEFSPLVSGQKMLQRLQEIEKGP